MTAAPDSDGALTPGGHAQWLVDFIGAGRPPASEEVEARFGPPFTEWLGIEGIVGMVSRMALALRVVGEPTVAPGSFRVLAGLKWAGPAHWRVDGDIDAETGRISVLGFNVLEIDGVDQIAVNAVAELTQEQRASLHDVFAANYRNPDHGYLEASLERINFVAAAWAGDCAVGFALSETRVVDLPRLPQQVIGLAGLSCVDPAFRRQGLGLRLEIAGMASGNGPATSQRMGTGRFAHAATWRRMAGWSGSVPRPGIVITEWHREVGAACAELLGVADFDADTFVSRGAGRPIGEPIIDIDADVGADVHGLFAPVDRSRGDQLIGVWWPAQNPPPDW